MLQVVGLIRGPHGEFRGLWRAAFFVDVLGENVLIEKVVAILYSFTAFPTLDLIYLIMGQITVLIVTVAVAHHYLTYRRDFPILIDIGQIRQTEIAGAFHGPTTRIRTTVTTHSSI